MTSWPSGRYLITGLLAVGCIASGQQPTGSPAKQKPGVPGVQAPMSFLIPDAQYKIEANGIKGGPDWLAMTEDSVWTNSRGTNMVFRMDAKSDKVIAAVPVPKPCSGFAVAAGTLWSPSCDEHVIYRIDLKTNEVVAKVPVGPANTEGGIAFGAGSAWMPSDPKGLVSRIDPATNKVIAEIAVPPDSFTAVYGYNRVWVSSTAKSVVSVIHPATNKVIAEIPVDANPRFMAAGEGFVWTLNQGTGTVTKIDPRTMKVVATIDAGVPGTGGDIATGEGALWVTERTIPVTRIDPATNKVTAQLYGPGGDAMRIGHGYVWLSNGREGKVWRFLAQKVISAASAFLDRRCPASRPRWRRQDGPSGRGSGNFHSRRAGQISHKAVERESRFKFHTENHAERQGRGKQVCSYRRRLDSHARRLRASMDSLLGLRYGIGQVQ